MTESGQYVMRKVRECELARMAVIRHDAFMENPHLDEQDELSRLLATEPDAELGRPATRDEALCQITSRLAESFAKPSSHVIGIYHLAHATKMIDHHDVHDSSDLPSSATLAGFAIWIKITPHSTPDSTHTDQIEQRRPSLLNRFSAQLNRTREREMKNKLYWFLKLLVIHPIFQRLGLGSKLVKWGTRRADSENIDAWLESSPMGIKTYLNTGFKVLGMDKIVEPRAANGFVEWPYMIYQPKPNHGQSQSQSEDQSQSQSQSH